MQGFVPVLLCTSIAWLTALVTWERGTSTEAGEVLYSSDYVRVVAVLCVYAVCFWWFVLRKGVFRPAHCGVWWWGAYACALLWHVQSVVLISMSARSIRGLLRRAGYTGITNLHSDQWNMQQDCSLSLTTAYRQLSSVWFMCHLFGWIQWMLIFRDWRICLLKATLFELCEITFQFLIPDFRECWWDSLIFDGLSNVLGMFVAVVIMRRLAIPFFSWWGPRGRAEEAFTDPRRLLCIVGLVLAGTIVDLNTFFAMYALWIPPSHPLMWRRFYTMLPAFTAMTHEWAGNLNRRPSRPLTSLSFLGTTALLMECLVCVKYGDNTFTHATTFPTTIVASWSAFAVLFSLWFFLHFRRARTLHRLLPTSWNSNSSSVGRVKHAHAERNLEPDQLTRGELQSSPRLRVLFWCSFTPLLVQTMFWCWPGFNDWVGAEGSAQAPHGQPQISS